MDAIQITPSDLKGSSLRETVIQIINTKIKKSDSGLKKYIAKLQNPNQKPNRSSDQDPSWIIKQKHVFDFIESSCKFKSKMFYLRLRANELNSVKILELLSTSRIHDLSLNELKDEIS